MNQSQIKLENIASHDFVKMSFGNAVAITEKLQTGSITKIDVEYARELDEYEFYIVEVGHKLAHLLNLCEQLVHAVLFLSAFTPTKRMKENGITRANHVQYNVENYLIRTQSFHDRVLKLSNAVFHLGLRPRDCRHDTIAKNLHVKNTGISSKLQSIRKLLGRYRQERNLIIHHEAYQEEDLRKLEMYYLARQLDKGLDNDTKNNFAHVGRNLTRDFVTQKMDEFDQFNVDVFQLLGLLFDDFKLRYESTATLLMQKCGHKNNMEKVE